MRIARAVPSWSRENVSADVGVSGYITATRSRGLQPGDELRERVADPRRVQQPRVVVVEEDGDDAEVVAARFPLLGIERGDGREITAGERHRVVLERDPLERVDRLRLAVFRDVEIRAVRSATGTPLPSVATTSTLTASTRVRNVGGRCGAALVGSATTSHPVQAAANASTTERARRWSRRSRQRRQGGMMPPS